MVVTYTTNSRHEAIKRLGDILGVPWSYWENRFIGQWPFDEDPAFEMLHHAPTMQDFIVVKGFVGGVPFAVKDLVEEFPSQRLINQLNLLRE